MTETDLIRLVSLDDPRLRAANLASVRTPVRPGDDANAVAVRYQAELRRALAEVARG